LNFLTNFDSVLVLQITVLNILCQWSFSNPSRLSVELCLWPAKQVRSFFYHVIKVTELVFWLSVPFLTHHCHTAIPIPHNHGHPQKFFQGGQRRHFAYGFQVAGEAIQTDVRKTLYPFQTTKKMHHFRAIVTKMRLRHRKLWLYFTQQDWRHFETRAANVWDLVKSSKRLGAHQWRAEGGTNGRERNEGGQGGTIPRAPNHYGGTESLRGAPNDCGWRRKVLNMPHVHSSI